MTLDYLEAKSKNESEREQKKQKNFDFGITMDQIMRKEVKSLYANYKSTAAVDMGVEAEDAWIENKVLSAELQKRLNLSLALLENQQKSYEQLKKIRIREEVDLHGVHLQEGIAESLAASTEKQHKIVGKISKIEEQLRLTFESTRRQYDYKLSMISALAEKRKLLHIAAIEHSKKKENAVKLVQHLIDSCLGYTDRDRMNVIKYLCSDPDADISEIRGLECINDESQVPEPQKYIQTKNNSSTALLEEEEIDQERFWNSKYKPKSTGKNISKFNISFSMAKPIV